MTTLRELQAHLKTTCRYAGEIDGIWGKLTEAGVLLMLTDGPDTKLTDDDLKEMAKRNDLGFAQVKAVTVVESSGAGFFKGRPIILPEPHRFSRATGGKFDRTNPNISYPKWGTYPYPGTQDARYDYLLKMVSLNVDAGFASASYGLFQILGENYKACGYSSPMAFAEAMARDEQTQLVAFESFLKNKGLMDELRDCSGTPHECEAFCAGYNGTAFRQNRYHEKMAEAIRKFF